MAGPVRLTGEQMLESALGDRIEIATRPQPTPRQVLGSWLQNFGAGIGAGVLTYVALLYVPVPADSVTASVTAGAATWGAAMLIAGTNDERKRLTADRHVRQAVKAIGREADARVEAAHDEAAASVERMAAQLRAAVNALDEADDEIEELRRSLDHMTRERDGLVYDLAREREARASGNYTPAVALAPKDIRDATEMVRYRYDRGAHLSRRDAVDSKQWTEPQWDKAMLVLKQAKIVTVDKGVTRYPDGRDEAHRLLGEYMIRVARLSVATVNKTLGIALYVDSDEG